MYKSILVPLDGSELSESILGHVKAIAGCSDKTKVILLNVHHSLDKDTKDTLDPVIAKKLDELYEQEARDYLNGISVKLKADRISADITTLTGNPAEEIINYAKNNKVDLILMSSHGRSGVSRWMFGSVADKVIKHSKIPVLVQPALE